MWNARRYSFFYFVRVQIRFWRLPGLGTILCVVYTYGPVFFTRESVFILSYLQKKHSLGFSFWSSFLSSPQAT